MKGIVVTLAVMFLIIAAGSCIMKNLELENNVSALKNRAQVAATPSEMKGYLSEFDRAIDRYGMNVGYTSFLYRNSWTDVSEVRKNIKRIIARVEAIESLSPSSEAYNQGMDDVRGILRELEFDPLGYWIWNQGGIWRIGVAIFLLLVLLVLLND